MLEALWSISSTTKNIKDRQTDRRHADTVGPGDVISGRTQNPGLVPQQ